MKSSGSSVETWSTSATVKEFSSLPLVAGRILPLPALSPSSPVSAAGADSPGAADSPGV